MNNFAPSDIATMTETQSSSSSSTTTNGNQQPSSAATESEQTLHQDESPTSPQIDISLSKIPASSASPPSPSPPSPATPFFILEELHSTSTTPPTILRPATVRAVFLSLQEARREMKRLVYACAEQPAARKVCVEEIFRRDVCVGEGYEYHLGAGLALRTLWVQEGVVGWDLEVGGGSESGEEGEGIREEKDGLERGSVRVQGGGARLSGGGGSLPGVCEGGSVGEGLVFDRL